MICRLRYEPALPCKRKETHFAEDFPIRYEYAEYL
jgi:hypothetical protein